MHGIDEHETYSNKTYIYILTNTNHTYFCYHCNSKTTVGQYISMKFSGLIYYCKIASYYIFVQVRFRTEVAYYAPQVQPERGSNS